MACCPVTHCVPRGTGSGRGDNELCPAPAGDDRARDGNVDEVSVVVVGSTAVVTFG